MSEPTKSRNEKNNPSRIITRRTGDVKSIIYNIFGGLTLGDLFFLAVCFIIASVLLVLLAKINLWLGVCCFIFVGLMAIILVVPRKSKDKIYQYLWKKSKFIFSRKKLTAPEIRMLNPIKQVTAEGIILTNNSCVMLFRIKATDISLKEEDEKQQAINGLYNVLKNIDLPLNFFCHDQPYEMIAQLEHIKTLNRTHFANPTYQTLKNNRQQQINNFAHQYQRMFRSPDHTQKVWFLAVYGSSFHQIRKRTQFNLAVFNPHLSFCPLTAKAVSDLASHLSFMQNGTRVTTVVHYSCYLKMDDTFVAVKSCSLYPLFVDYAWLLPFAELTDIKIFIRINRLSEWDAIKKLDKAIIKTEGSDRKKASHNVESDFYLSNFFTLLELIKNHGEGMKMVTLYFLVTAHTLPSLNHKIEILKNKLSQYRFQMDPLRFEQLTAIYNCFGFLAQNEIDKGQEICFDTLSCMWPFFPEALRDREGLYLGHDQFRNPVVFDIKVRSTVRTNSNCIVLGMTGFGKTYNVAKQINWLLLNDVHVFIIDPEREYHQLAHYYQGQIITVGQDANSKLNPLEVFGENLMEHINFMEQFLRVLYQGLTDFDFAFWQQIMLATYQQKNIDQNTNFSKLQPGDYPLLQDLYRTAQAWKSKNKTDYDFFRLNGILWKLAYGSDGYLWNEPSTIQNDSQGLIIFDIHDLPANENIKNAQLFLMLSFLHRKIKQNKHQNAKMQKQHNQKWIAVIIDEAHLLVNENNLLTLNFLFQMTKRMRKYCGIIYLISQNVNDFMGNATIKTQTQGIINNCPYMFIHHLAPHDLSDLNQLLQAGGALNAHHKHCITNAGLGVALFINNNERTIVRIETFGSESHAWQKKLKKSITEETKDTL